MGKKAQITEAILKQKVANNKKTDALYVEFRERQENSEEPDQAAKANEEQCDRILLRIARIATGTAVRWKRETKANDNSEMQTGEMEGDKGEKVKYLSRLLTCTRCGSEQETKEKQLKIKAGFRAIHCKRCGKQEKGAQ